MNFSFDNILVLILNNLGYSGISINNNKILNNKIISESPNTCPKRKSTMTTRPKAPQILSGTTWRICRTSWKMTSTTS